MQKHLKNRCVFLDRDGVINKPIIIKNKPYAPKNNNQFQIFTEIIPLLKKICELDFILVVITNQPDISTKEITTDQCSCRKPKPGLTNDAIRDFNIEPKASYYIGDRWKDIDLANSIGCFSIFIDYNYDEKLKTKPKKIVKSSREACEVILSLESKKL